MEVLGLKVAQNTNTQAVEAADSANYLTVERELCSKYRIARNPLWQRAVEIFQGAVSEPTKSMKRDLSASDVGIRQDNMKWLKDSLPSW